ncbi:unnamed protein product [Staurois parvus]|uniref:Uncharacterized protein n=1 Tax=Staurois parvus TaxID=386267 RepID=A0ABN9BG89_9NEOB|nr:unnamed protein product [Staurois parvus]
MTAGCPVRMSEKHLRFVIGPAASGICQCPRYRTALPFTKSTASCACALGTRLSSPAPTLQKLGRQRAAG